jgi:N-acyl-D-aspartate/D-glutamate deacylase
MQLASFDYADVRGGRIVPLTLPDSLRVRMNLRSGVGLDTLPGWAKVMALGDDQKLAFLSDPIRRAELGELAASAEGAARQKVDWASYVLVESAGKKGKRWTGSTIGAVADALGTDPWNALIDIVVDDRLNTVISKPDNGQDDISWQARVDCWRDPRVLVGASDAGAHLDMLDSFAYPTTLLSRAVRERALLPVEEAVQMLTDRPARFYGLRDRGVLLPGSWADVVVFDLGTVGPGEIHTRYDLPAGAGRLYGEANGVEVVLVNGVPVVENGQFVPARPGRVLRSGRDTVTVPVGRTGSNGR